MKLGWMSDIHLNFLKEKELQAFILKLLSYDVDGWLISGDIGTSINTIYFLDILADNLPQPIYFVLGNHDFYHSSLDKTTSAIKKFVHLNTFSLRAPKSAPYSPCFQPEHTP